MEPDVMLVCGMALLVLSLPAIISAWAEQRAPQVGALLSLGGGGMVLWAIRTREPGYTWSELPEVIYSVIGQIIN